MRKAFTILAIASFALLACQKETALIEDQNVQDAVQSNIPTEIVCEIADAPTKTQYAGNITFGWTQNDLIRMPVKNGSNQVNFFSFTAQDVTDGDATASFKRSNASDYLEGASAFDPTSVSWNNMGYLVYPVSIFNFNGNQADGTWNSGGYPIVNLSTSYTYSSSNPLDGGIVPLIGRKVGDTYKFSTAVGFLKVSIANITSTATAVKLVSSSKQISGKMAISNSDAQYDGSEVYIAQIANTDGAGTITLNVTGLTEGNSYDFYFPLPVGTYASSTLSIQVIGASNGVLMDKTINKEVNIDRNCILSVPKLTYHKVAVKGLISKPLLYTTKPTGANTIRVNISSNKLTTDNYTKANWPEGNRYGASQSGADLTGLKNTSSVAFLTTSGNYYLQYIVCSSSTQPNSLTDENVMFYGSVPFKFKTESDVSSLDETSVYGSYTVNLISAWGAYLSPSSLTITDSDNDTNGNVMITSILGNDCIIYGTYNSGEIEFSEDQIWYVDGNGSDHRLISNWSGTYTGTWSLRLSAQANVDIELKSYYLLNEWYKGEDKNYDNAYSALNCFKE